MDALPERMAKCSYRLDLCVVYGDIYFAHSSLELSTCLSAHLHIYFVFAAQSMTGSFTSDASVQQHLGLVPLPWNYTVITP